MGETTRPFRYDLNQIPYDYTGEVRNRFKGLDLIDRVPDEFRTETGIKTIPMEKKCKKAKWLSGEALQMAVKRREVKSKGEKERYTHLNAEFQRIARRDKKAFLSDQCKEIMENNQMGKTRDLFMKSSLGISNFLEEISCLFHSIVFLYFFALITEKGFLISPCYSLKLCIQMGISFLFSFAFGFSSFLSYF